MGRLINADTIVHYQTYDDEHEDFQEHESTIADFLDDMTDEGCPNPVDAVPVRHGRWEKCLGKELSCKCSVCTSKYDIPWRYCPNCGTRMDWKDGNNEKAD